MGRTSRTMVAWMLAALLLPPGAASQPAPVVLDAIVATVNGAVITASDVRAATLLSGGGPAGAEAVARLVDRTLMLDEVERAAQGMPPPEAVEARRRDVDTLLGAEARALIASRDAMTEGRLLAWVRDDLRIEAYLAQRFTAAAQPTDEEVAAYFATNAARFVEPGVPADDAATARARTALTEARRQALIGAWLDGLRRRADIVAAPR